MDTNLDIVKWASELASGLLSPLEKRWRHVQGVTQRAYQIAGILPENEQVYLIAAAYLHDIGYAPAIQRTGFHPLDGAYYLRGQQQERLARLVAHHSEARCEAGLRGFASELILFPREHSAVADALTYCDMTTSPIGEHITYQARIDDIFSRYGETDIVTQAIKQAMPALWQAVERTQGLMGKQLS